MGLNNIHSNLREPPPILIKKESSLFFYLTKDLIVMAMRENDEKHLLVFVNSVFGQGMHLKHVESLANAALGLLHAEALLLHKIGDRKLKVNTVKTKTHALRRQGIIGDKFLQQFTEDERTNLLDAFNKLHELNFQITCMKHYLFFLE